jgi:hypothetical protein
MNHPSEEVTKVSKSLARRRARLIQPKVRSAIQRLGKTTKPFNYY